jgi:4a-hydroxytetrahydrobiopterin dehydratase
MARTVPPLPADELKGFLAAHAGWAVGAEGMLEKTYDRKGFPEALAFVQAVGALAQAQDHHPDLDVRFGKVTLRLITHDAGGLSALDVKLAIAVDALP